MDEELKIDGNGRWVLGGITNDANEYIRNARVNPITGALIVEANVVSSNTQIGSTIPGGTDGSVLFIGLGSTLAQDNANFFWDDTNNFLGLGTNTPSTTLHVVGDAIITGDAGTADQLLGRDSGTGEISGITVGSGLTLAAGVLSATGGGGGGYNQVQDNGVNVTQRTTLNFVDYFTVTDGGGVTNTSIDVATLGADATFISTLESNLDLANISGQIDLATQVTGLLPAANIDITNLESTLDLANIAGQISLTTQVSGTLGATNGGTGQNAVAQGDLLYGSAVNTWSRLAKNTSATRYLSNTGTSNNPAWAQVDLSNGVTGVLPLANGGTGSNLTDPGANRLWGWDDTDNSIGFWTIGSGLSYDHATHTISSTGSGIYTVNADETIDTWFTWTTPIVYESTTAGKNIAGYTSVNIDDTATTDLGGAGSTIILTDSTNASLYSHLPGAVSTNFTMADSKALRVKMRWQSDGSTAANVQAFGIVDANSTLYAANTSTANGIRFCWDNSVLYASMGDGTNNTTTNITGSYSATDYLLYEIVIIPGTSVTFYVNGNQEAQYVTNIPTGSLQYWGYGFSASGRSCHTSPVTYSLEM